jgi:hypothetical protein
MGLSSLIGRRLRRSDSQPLSFDEWVSYFSYGGELYPLLQQTLAGDRETIDANFAGFSRAALKGSSVVATCMFARLLLFSEARFQFRRLNNGRPGELFGTQALAPLETPWPGATTGDLLARLIMDADLAGNAYSVGRQGARIKRLRPDWVTIVLGSDQDPEVDGWDIDAEVVGYLYHPGGPGSGREPETLLPEQVGHFAPLPDPEARFRGMSWLTPIVREILADKATTKHKLKFFQFGATPNLKVKFDVSDPDKFRKWVELFKEEHEGEANAFRTLFLAAGADADVIGSNLRDIDFAKVQGGGEIRIAAAARVPASIALLGKSLEGSALNNDAKDGARRLFADIAMRPLWRNVCGSLAHLIDVPAGAELWYDTRDIAFLKDDVKDAAEAIQTEAAAINTLVTAGFTPDSAVAAVVAGDLTLLEHSGLVSVQLLPPGTAGAELVTEQVMAALSRLGVAGAGSNGHAAAPVLP